MLVTLMVVFMPWATNLYHTSSSAVPPQLLTATLEFVALTTVPLTKVAGQEVEDVNTTALVIASLAGACANKVAENEKQQKNRKKALILTKYMVLRIWISIERCKSKGLYLYYQ